MKSLKVRPIPVPANAHHPSVPFADILPQHVFTMGLIAPKGSGKTTIIINLLDFYKKYFHTIVIFSPTIHADEKWQHVRKNDYLSENIDLKNWLQKKNNERKVNIIVGEPGMSSDRKKKEDRNFDGRIPSDMMKEEYDEELLQSLMDEQLEQVAKIEELGGTQHLANRILFIFDDLVGSNLFNNRRRNAFKKLNAMCRHHSISIIMVTQAYKEIQSTVRTQFSSIILFDISNQKELDKIFEENTVNLKREAWDYMYNHCIKEPYGFLFINYQKPKLLRCMKNFDQILYFKNNDVENNNDNDNENE